MIGLLVAFKKVSAAEGCLQDQLQLQHNIKKKNGDVKEKGMYS